MVEQQPPSQPDHNRDTQKGEAKRGERPFGLKDIILAAIFAAFLGLDVLAFSEWWVPWALLVTFAVVAWLIGSNLFRSLKDRIGFLQRKWTWPLTFLILLLAHMSAGDTFTDF
jgi:hypothetical protein